MCWPATSPSRWRRSSSTRGRSRSQWCGRPGPSNTRGSDRPARSVMGLVWLLWRPGNRRIDVGGWERVPERSRQGSGHSRKGGVHVHPTHRGTAPAARRATRVLTARTRIHGAHGRGPRVEDGGCRKPGHPGPADAAGRRGADRRCVPAVVPERGRHQDHHADLRGPSGHGDGPPALGRSHRHPDRVPGHPRPGSPDRVADPPGGGAGDRGHDPVRDPDVPGSRERIHERPRRGLLAGPGRSRRGPGRWVLRYPAPSGGDRRSHRGGHDRTVAADRTATSTRTAGPGKQHSPAFAFARFDGVSGRYLIRTFGCQMNEHDSERIAGLLEGEGYGPAQEPAEAEVVVLNTCAIRENADNRLYGALGHLKPLKDANPRLRIVVAGCLAQKDRGLIQRKAPWVDVVVGTHALAGLIELIRSAERDGPQMDVREFTEVFPSALPAHRGSTSHAWVSVSVGCDNGCTFCIVPLVRGPQRSRPLGDVVREVQGLAGQGVVEVTLLGQNVNTYGRDLTVPGSEERRVGKECRS